MQLTIVLAAVGGVAQWPLVHGQAIVFDAAHASGAYISLQTKNLDLKLDRDSQLLMSLKPRGQSFDFLPLTWSPLDPAMVSITGAMLQSATVASALPHGPARIHPPHAAR